MKLKYCLSILILTLSHSLLSQMGFSSKVPLHSDSIKRTFFVYRTADDDKLDDLSKVLNENWKHSEIKLISFEEYTELIPVKGDLIFQVANSFHQSFTPQQVEAGTGKVIHSGGVAINSVNFWLSAALYSSDKNFSQIASANLAVEESLIVDVCSKTKTPLEILTSTYTKVEIYNWDMAYLSSFVAMCSQFIFDPYLNLAETPKADLAKLKTQKLYISDAVNVDLKRLANKDVRADKSKKVQAAYKLSSEIVSAEKLDKMALEGSEEIVMYFIRYGDGGYILVLDLKTNSILYRAKSKKYKYNIETKDLKKLKKAISKS